jgi:hypothetical protein
MLALLGFSITLRESYWTIIAPLRSSGALVLSFSTRGYLFSAGQLVISGKSMDARRSVIR